MPNQYAPSVSDDEVIAVITSSTTMEIAAQKLGMTSNSLRKRRKRMEHKLGRVISAANPTSPRSAAKLQHAPGRLHIQTENGVHLIGSDAHIWPGDLTTAQRAFIRFAKELRPAAVHLNGDIFDGADISRFQRIGWNRAPTVKDELEACLDFTGALEKSAPEAAKFWELGNHDARFECRLAALAPEYEGVHGFSLKDHFPAWNPCWSVWVNEDVAIKHKWHQGVHAKYNNTLRSGMSVITGHLHGLGCTEWTDYKGTRYGVDSGTLAEPYSVQFNNYTEDSPKNWRSGFVVLTFHEGIMLRPELVQVFDETHVEFRGQVIEV